jgi:hypothetical protein
MCVAETVLATSRSATEPQTQSSLTKLSDAAPVAFEQAAANLSYQVIADKQTSIIRKDAATVHPLNPFFGGH